MKISSILCDGRPSLSFEVFPPKTDSAFDDVCAAAEEIARLNPSFMSVTYGAGGGTSRYTLELCERLSRTYGVPTLAHLTCVSSTRETVAERLSEIRARGIENVMALRGDLTPELEQSDRTGWAYAHAVDLIRDIRASGDDLCIGGACYPETHPESAGQADDIRHLCEKVDAGCSFLTTQMFFDNDLLYRFLDNIRRAGISVPVVAGIMPITAARQIERTIKLSGSFLPPRFKDKVERFADDPSAIKQAGIDYATEQIFDLFAHGVNHVHVYSMNKPDVAAKISQNLCDLVRR